MPPLDPENLDRVAQAVLRYPYDILERAEKLRIAEIACLEAQVPAEEQPA
jgi:hypothetical protein